MHSAELARLAGVTVRALRHYHQVGVLDEPDRGSNGYRNYDVHDLVRVLRIKRLASVGIALESMPPLLDDRADDTDRQLEDLDGELAAQIDRLSAQREVIANLRRHRVAPDVPPELAPFLGRFSAAVSPAMARYDRDQSVLLAHLAGAEGLAQVAALYERLSSADLAPAIADLSGRFDRLVPESDDREIEQMVDDFVAAFTPVMEELADVGAGMDLGASSGIFDEHAADRLNVAQRRALTLLEARFGATRDTERPGID